MSMSRAWLTLALAPGLGPATARTLVQRFGDAAAVCAAGGRELAAAGLSQAAVDAILRPAGERFEASVAWLESSPLHQLLGLDDPRYPQLLREIADPPLVLFVRGDAACLGEPQLAIVGSRNATASGAETACNFARHLAGCGLTVTSGLALGIDAAAHRGALDGGGRSIAVLGTGPDRVYPRAHAALAEELALHGVVVSEFPPGTPPLRANFPQRNRIISGLSVGVLVVEAGVQSGALVTAGFARDQGREVFAVPGSIHNPLAKGCHRLIRQGAKLVETAADVLEELPELLAVASAPAVEQSTPDAVAPGDDPEYARLLNAMGFDTLDTESAARRSGLTIAEVSSMLLILELQGRVEALPGGRFVRRGSPERHAGERAR